MKNILLSVLMAFAFTACATDYMNLKSPVAITKDKLEKIIEDKTVKNDITAIFGKPQDNYMYVKTEVWFYKDLNLRSLYIEFNNDGTVKSYNSD